MTPTRDQIDHLVMAIRGSGRMSYSDNGDKRYSTPPLVLDLLEEHAELEIGLHAEPYENFRIIEGRLAVFLTPEVTLPPLHPDLVPTSGWLRSIEQRVQNLEDTISQFVATNANETATRIKALEVWSKAVSDCFKIK